MSLLALHCRSTDDHHGAVAHKSTVAAQEQLTLEALVIPCDQPHKQECLQGQHEVRLKGGGGAIAKIRDRRSSARSC